LPAEVAVYFNDQRVERLTKTTLIFWNSGTSVLNGEDGVATDPIRICFNDGDRILSYKIIKATKNTNNCRLLRAADALLIPHQIEIAFDYLDAGDGVTIELLHDSEKRYPVMRGTIRGVPKGIIDRGNPVDYMPRSFLGIPVPLPKPLFKPLAWFMLAVSIGCIGVVGRAWLYPLENGASLGSSRTTQIGMFAFGLLYAFTSGVLLWASRKRYPKILAVD
jgi:hypothetical protein